jgi:polyhydroxyalkanoate synthesis regulator phasin
MTDKIRVRQDGQPLGYFPGSVTPGEAHRIEAIDAVHEICNEYQIPATNGTAVLTVEERVQRLADEVTIARKAEELLQERVENLQRAYNALSD